MDPEFVSAPAGVSAAAYPVPQPSNADFDDESDAPSSLDHPPLETCKRELDAVLAALDP